MAHHRSNSPVAAALTSAPLAIPHRLGRSKICAQLMGAIFLTVCFVAELAQAQPVTNPLSYGRSSSFTYLANGLLSSETIEPESSDHCLTTSYIYDSNGNKVSATTANCAATSTLAAIEPRTTVSTFGAASVVLAMSSGTVSVGIPAGAFPGSATNAAGHSETRKYDPRFGQVIELIGPNQLKTTWQLDDYGRKVREVRSDNTQSVVNYCLLGGPGLIATNDLSSNSTYCETPPPAIEIPALAIRFEHSVVLNTGGQAISAATRVYFDRAGRKIRTVTESFDSGGTASRWIVQDTDFTEFGAVRLTSQPYFLDTGSSRASGGFSDVGGTMTFYDALGRATTVLTADPNGSAGLQQFRPGVNRVAAGTTVNYSGLQTTTTDDKGRTRTEEKDPEGRVFRITDALGAQVTHQYDAFGNLIGTRDALSNQISITYDVRGRKIVSNDPDAGVTAYCYDALGQLRAQQSSKQRGNHGGSTCPSLSLTGIKVAPTAAGWTTMAYDVLGRMVHRVEAEFASTWQFDKNENGTQCGKGTGRLCQVASTHGLAKQYTYDDLGRASSSRMDVSGDSLIFVSSVTYDGDTGRLATQTYPTGLAISYQYTAKGYLAGIRTVNKITINPLPSVPGGALAEGKIIAAGQLLWEAKAVNAWGKAETQEYSANGVISKDIFEANTGRVTEQTAGTAAANAGVMSYRYTWDSLNQLASRADDIGDSQAQPVAVTDTFTYDVLGRLTKYTVAGGGSSRAVDLAYNALGMILGKSDVGNYLYPAQGGANTRPHGLVSVAGSYNSSYTYDLNGNVTSASAGKYSTVSYNSFNMPDSQNGIQGPAGTPKYTWVYDENHQRIKETRLVGPASNAVLRTTWSLHPDAQGGLGFEREVGPTGALSASNRHYLSAGGQVIGVIVTVGDLIPVAAGGDITAVKLEYWHKDHLGSLVATTDHNGAVTARYAYDPFGKRRSTSASYDSFGGIVVDWTTNTNSGTDRGFTGHEHMDDVGLIHMNGRVFDPTVARFMQADPFIQDPLNLQNFDRYGYCYNNPLTCTDPSGYSFNLFRFVASFVMDLVCPICGTAYRINMVAKTEIGYQVGSIAINVACYIYGGGPQCVAGGQAAWAAIAGHNLSSSIKIGIQAGVSSYVNGLIGGIGDPVTNAAAHAAWGCAEGRMSGGGCGAGARGAIAYGALKYAGFGGNSDSIKDTGQLVINTMVEAAAGGLASVAGGGSFAQGARSAAMAYLFNQMRPNGRDPNIRGDIGVEQAKEMFIERGYAILADQVVATIDGFPVRKYDFLVQGPDGSLRGVEVKTTIGEIFKFNLTQVAFDAEVYLAGARSQYGLITSVGYVGVGFGIVPKTFQSLAVQMMLSTTGVKFDVITGLKVKGK